MQTIGGRMKYYEIKVKCGHVGKNNYYVGTLYLYGENGREAAAYARRHPRVKHDHKDAILCVKEISHEAYLKGKSDTRKSVYWTSTCIQQQRMYFPELENQVLQEDNKKNQYKKNHSLRKNYNAFDPMYCEYSRYHGRIETAAL